MIVARKGDKIRIKGDWTDMTDHLDDQVGEVVEVRSSDYVVRVNGELFAIWPYNIKEVVA